MKKIALFDLSLQEIREAIKSEIKPVDVKAVGFIKTLPGSLAQYVIVWWDKEEGEFCVSTATFFMSDARSLFKSNIKLKELAPMPEDTASTLEEAISRAKKLGPHKMVTADLALAKDCLKVSLDVVTTNEPINRQEGDVSQADLEAETAASINEALALLETASHTAGSRDLAKRVADLFNKKLADKKHARAIVTIEGNVRFDFFPLPGHPHIEREIVADFKTGDMQDWLIEQGITKPFILFAGQHRGDPDFTVVISTTNLP